MRIILKIYTNFIVLGQLYYFRYVLCLCRYKLLTLQCHFCCIKLTVPAPIDSSGYFSKLKCGIGNELFVVDGKCLQCYISFSVVLIYFSDGCFKIKSQEKIFIILKISFSSKQINSYFQQETCLFSRLLHL